MRALGCPNCGLWLLRNTRTRIYWVRIAAVVIGLSALGVASVIGVDHLVDIQSMESILLRGLPISIAAALGTWLVNTHCVFLIGPPLLPADGTRANVGRRT